MAAVLTSCPAVLALELVPEGTPSALRLPLESAPLLGDAIANDLARLIPGVETMGLAVSAALYDQAQILRPGWPIHAELARMHQQAQRGGWAPAITSFGASAGRMAAPVLEPDARLIGSPLLLVPFVLVGHAADAKQVGAQMERDFEEKGLADSNTALLLNEAFSIRVEHARYLTHHDLCALTATAIRTRRLRRDLVDPRMRAAVAGARAARVAGRCGRAALPRRARHDFRRCAIRRPSPGPRHPQRARNFGRRDVGAAPAATADALRPVFATPRDRDDRTIRRQRSRPGSLLHRIDEAMRRVHGAKR